MNSKITLFFLLSICSFSISAQVWKTYPYTPTTTPSSQISFSTDEGRHTLEPVEWWYTSGHFTGTTSGKEYSYMLTYFYYPVSVLTLNFDGFRILNVTDEATGEFYQDTQPLTYSTLSTMGLDIGASLFPSGSEYWRNTLDSNSNPIPFQYELSASSSSVSLNFELNTTKRPLILGDDGYFEQGLANYTYYYSQTANTLTGSFSLNGATPETVSGTAWIDRQYGNFNPFTGEKYEWFSLQLDNGTDLNLWNIFTADRTIPNDAKYKIMSAYVDDSNQYTISDFEIERLEYFVTPDNQKRYSKKWRLTSTSKNIDLTITANHTDSEVNITQLSFRFFEGSVSVSGTINGTTVSGVGFAELLHDYENPDVSITSPSGGVYNTSNPITWTVNNPDDGRPLLYDLEYSTDNSNFTSIATGLTNPSYTWDGSGITNGESVWFKVTSYSVDNTLKSEVISSSSSSATLSAVNFDKNDVMVYPNPVENDMILNFQSILTGSTIKIMDINGRVLSTKKTDNSLVQKINTQFLSQGLYFLQVNSDNFHQVIKFVKK
ncbi:lipocalin-like domain-containing protein [Yeosuana marina]|uniref:lipocalin-like domain-containing protein n=1 Tax=Yeosuana marina TaxID=1565536 RepID=UPI0030EE9768|tara:strand:+ start:140 stop:1780 length:1641 start_codon:yes stop_codon:yes gene_type:complete